MPNGLLTKTAQKLLPSKQTRGSVVSRKSSYLFFIIFFLSAALVITSSGANAQANDTINFQSKIVDKTTGLNVSAGSPSCVVGGADTCDFRVSIYDSPAAGTLLWQETHSNVELGDVGGVFNLALNSVCSDWAGGCAGAGSGIDWGADSTIYLEVEFDTDGNGDFVSAETFDRKVFTSVPFAYYADNSNLLDGFDSSDFVQLQPAAAQVAAGTDPLIWLNETGAGTPNLLQLQTGGVDQFVLGNSGSAIFNEQGNAVDFRIEGDTDGNLFFVDGSADAIGIGTASPAGKLDIQASNSVASGTTIGIYGVNTQTGASTGVTYGSQFMSVVNPGAAATIADSIGSASLAVMQGDGTVTTAAASTVKVINQSAGIISTSVGLQVNGASNSGAGSITTNYGIRVANQSAGGTDYGIYISGADDYALYIAADKARFAPATTGTASIQIATSAGVNPTTPVSGDLWWNGTNLYFYDGSSNQDLLAGGGSSLFTDGGTFTYLTSTTDDLILGGSTVGTADIFFGDDGSAIFNEQGSAVDFRIEGDTDANLLFVDGSADAVGIGTNTPSSIFHVVENTSVASGTTSAGLVTNTRTGASTGTVKALNVQGWSNPGTGNTINEVHGLSSNVYMNDAGTTTVATGGLFNIQNLSTGTINNARALQVNSTTNSGGGTINNNYGLIIWDQTAGINNYAIQTNAGNIVFNEGGDASTDFRVEGDTDTNLFFVDGSTNKVGIGTNDTNWAKLYVAESGSDRGILSVNTKTGAYGGNITGGEFQGIANPGTSNTINMAQGLSGAVYMQDAGTLTTAAAGLFSISNTSTGTISSANGVQINTFNNTGGGTINAATGLIIWDQNAATTNYAIQTHAGNVVFNQFGDANTDFRVEGDTDANLFFVDGGLNTIGIGTGAAGDTKLAVLTSNSVSSGNTLGLSVNNTQTGASTGVTGGANIGSYANPGTSNTIAHNIAISGFSFLSSAGTLTNAYSGQFQTVNSGTGTITNARGLQVESTLNTGGGTITTNYGLFVGDQTVAGTDYGVYIEGADDYALYINADKARFAPATTGTASIQIPTSGAVDPTTPVSGDLWWNGTNLYFYDGSGNVDLLTGGTGSSLFTDGGTVTYLTSTADDIAFGGTTLASPFSVDVDANTVRIGDGVNDANDPSLTFYASDATNSGTLSYSDADNFVFTGGGVQGLQHAAFGADSAIDSGSLLYGGTYSNILSLQEEFTDLSVGTVSGITNYSLLNPSGVVSAGVYGLDSEVQTQAGNAQNFQNVVGGYIQADHQGDGSTVGVGGLISYGFNGGTTGTTATDVWGIWTQSSNYDAGAVTTLHGTYSGADNSGTGTVTTAYAFNGAVTNTSTGTITTAYGLNIGSAVNSGGGTLTTNYGVYVDNQTAGTNDFAIVTNAGNIVFNEGGDASTDFRVEGDTNANLLFVDGSADAVGIGTNAPASRLHVTGNTTDVWGTTFSPTLTAPVVFSGIFEVNGTIEPSVSSSVLYGQVILPGINTTANNVTLLDGLFIRPELDSGYTGTVANIRGIDIASPAVAGASSITYNHGLYVQDQSIATSTDFGVYIEGADDYALYINADKARFAPATTGAASVQLASSSGTNPTTPVSGDLWWNGTNLYFYDGTTNRDLLSESGAVFEVYDNTGGQTFTTNVVVNLDTVRQSDPNYSLATDEITVNSDGKYDITFTCTTDVNTGSARSVSQCLLQLDTGAGFGIVDGTDCRMYNRIAGVGANSCSRRIVLDLNNGDKIRLRASRTTGTDTIQTVADGSAITIMKTNGSGSSSLFTDGGTVTYLTSTTDDFAIGGSALASPFSMDVDTNTMRIGDGVSDTNDPNITFYASDATNSGTLSYLDADAFSFTGGTVRINTLAAASATQVCIDGSNNLSTCSSSIRYKENVADLDLGLDTIQALRPVSFDWKSDGRQDLGFIAEETELVDSRLVYYYNGQIEGVNYSQMTAVLAKAIQEQQAQIDLLASIDLSTFQTTMDNLSSDVAALKTRMDAAEAKITQLRTDVDDLIANGVSIPNDLTLNSLTTALITVSGEAIFNGKVTINGKVVFANHVAFSGDTIGTATVVAGTSVIRVTFSQAYSQAPIVTLTPAGLYGVDYAVSNVDVNGFDIVVGGIQLTDMDFNWHAFSK